MIMQREPKRLATATMLAVALSALLTWGSVAAGAAGALDPGVDAKSVKLGFVSSKTGVAAAATANADTGCQARVDRQNRAGGVNGRKIEVVSSDDLSSQNTQTVQDLVLNQDVFAVVNDSALGFLTYRWLADNKVPTIGAGFDGIYYGTPGNERIISAFGNVSPTIGVANDLLPKVMKSMGGTKVAVLASGVSPSSTAAAQSLQKYAVPSVGMQAVYTNTSVDFGTTDVGPLVLGVKNSGADSLYLPLTADTNTAVVQGLAQNGVVPKSIIMATGYGQPLLDQPAAKTFGPNVLMATTWAPVELKTKATKQFQADLKKVGYTGVPDFGIYTGYIDCDLAIIGLQHAGTTPTRQAFVDGLHQLGHFNPGGGLGCQDLDISLQNYGKSSPNACNWYVRLKDGKFVVFKQKNGKSIWTGKVVEASKNVLAETTTTAASP
jgi:branched-chain amino acid transport system substrate-binding protein